MARERGIERYYRQVREIRDELGITHDEARERWSEYYAPGGTSIKPIKKNILKPDGKTRVVVRASTSRSCPFCRDQIQQTDPTYTCTSCNTNYHPDCFQDELGGRCTTLGCAARRNPPRSIPRPPPVPATAPNSFFVIQTGRDPIEVQHEHDAYRLAAQLVGPGRDVHVSRTPPPPERPAGEPHHTLMQPEEDYAARLPVRNDNERMEDEALRCVLETPSERRRRSRFVSFFEIVVIPTIQDLYDNWGPLFVMIVTVVLTLIVAGIAKILAAS